MKKISLKNVKETLSRKEMRVIAGGYRTPECLSSCNSNSDCKDQFCPHCTSGACSNY